MSSSQFASLEAVEITIVFAPDTDEIGVCRAMGKAGGVQKCTRVR